MPFFRLIGIFLLLLFFTIGYGQEGKQDSIKTRYQKIENFSKRSKFTTFIHKLVFKSTAVKPAAKNISNGKINHTKYEGKIIRNISVRTLDPFGFSENDSTKKPKRFLEKVGNSVHIKSKNFAIKNLILLKKNQVYDSLLVKESERLVRRQRFVRRVRISCEPISPTSDSLDITIHVLDSWSLVPFVNITPSRATYELTERNFLGFGHQWSNRFLQNLNDEKTAYSTQYIIPNIKNTYIRTRFNYQIDLLDNYFKSVNIDRPFFSPLTKWGGGLNIENRFLRDSLPDGLNIYRKENFKRTNIDLWIGYSHPLEEGKSEINRVTNFITTLGYTNTQFTEKPGLETDPNRFFSNETSWLAGFGFSSRNFVKDYYIFNFEIPEDIPIGKYFGMTTGFQDKNNQSRLYIGSRATLGNYFKWGYLSTNYEFGTYFNRGKTEQSAFVFQLNYFTPLQYIGNWKIRQFFKTNMVLGGNRVDSEGDRISINENFGLSGFNVPKFLGTKKILVSFQTQTYSPWNVAGFRFSPFFNYSLAFLGNAEHDFNKSQGYSKIGAGFIITNDYLVFNSFQLSLAFYPKIPTQGENIFQSNTFRTSDFGYLDFEDFKPRTVLYE